MRPFVSFLLALSFAMGSMAKGRGGGGGGSSSGGSIDDNWNAPGTIKAAMAFDIIWFVFITGQFVTILRRLRFVPPGRYTRAPYILLAVVVGPLALVYLLLAIYTRVYTNMSYPAMHNFNSVIDFLFAIDIAFRPAVCLWLVHLRGNLAQTTQGNKFKPWVCQLWKRIIDWSLVALVFLFAISIMANLANMWALSDADRLSSEEYDGYLKARRGLNFTILAFGLLLLADITVSFIALKVSQRNMNFIDPISTRLLASVLPFVIIDFIASLVFVIVRETHDPFDFDQNAQYLADIIITGVVRVGVIGGLLSTMTISNTLWVPTATHPGTVSGYAPQHTQQSQQSSYQSLWQNSPSVPAPGQYPHPGQYQAPQTQPLAHRA